MITPMAKYKPGVLLTSGHESYKCNFLLSTSVYNVRGVLGKKLRPHSSKPVQLVLCFLRMLAKVDRLAFITHDQV